MPRVRIELTTPGFSDQCSTTELPRRKRLVDFNKWYRALTNSLLMEDYLELHDPKARRQIHKSKRIFMPITLERLRIFWRTFIVEKQSDRQSSARRYDAEILFRSGH